MIGRTAWWRHLLVVAAVLVVTMAAFGGVIGEPQVSEHIEGLQVTISPASGEGDGIRIREVIDQDFGSASRHGPELVIPTDFGVPTEVTAASADAPDAVSTTAVAEGERIRIGDPDETVTGQHRYQLSYVLPDARLSTGELAVDAVGAESDIPIDDVEVNVVGLDLTDPTCNVGRVATSGGCRLEPLDRGYRTRVDHLDAREGITIGGTIVSRTDVTRPATPALPSRRQHHRGRNGLVALGLSVLAAGLVYLWAVRTGSNDVSSADATDAAFGGPPPDPGDLPTSSGPGPRRLTDAQLGELTTIEFAPPSGIEPWQGALALRERVDDDLVTAWFSGAVARELLVIERDGPEVRLSPGPKVQTADPYTGQILAAMFGGRSDVTLGRYDERFSDAWAAVRTSQQQWAGASGWWRSRPPRAKRAGAGPGCLVAIIGALWCAFPLLGFLSVALVAFGASGSSAGLFVVAVAVPALVARFAYAPLLPGRSASGSAYALRTESFRRFLAESEGQHVEWAWNQGLLRQYSAWAVALGAADAWSRAMAASSVPPAETTNLTTPLLVYSMASSFTTTHTVPAPSGGGFGGGGFSGGSVGGGGGGGSHGSW